MRLSVAFPCTCSGVEGFGRVLAVVSVVDALLLVEMGEQASEGTVHPAERVCGTMTTVFFFFNWNSQTSAIARRVPGRE